MQLKAEIFDKLQFLFETYKFNDHQLHCVVNFRGKINKAAMKRAVELTLVSIPILKCRYVENTKDPFWKDTQSINGEDLFKVVYSRIEFTKFMTSRTNELKGPQVMACVLTSYQDSLGVIMNHMVCDAAAFKDYMYLLCDIYNNLLENINYEPKEIWNGNRSISGIMDTFKLHSKINSLMFNKGESNQKCDYKFPMNSLKDTLLPRIYTHTIYETRYNKLRNFCKLNNVTVNDVLLAAYYRVVYEIVHIDVKKPLNIPIMVDMRRYLKDKRVNSICNLTSIVITNVGDKLGENFIDTVKRVNRDMNIKKSKCLGLEGFIKISITHKLLSYSILKKAMRHGFKNPLIGMTNIGIIDDKRLIFKKAEIETAFMCGSIKYAPYFQLAISSFRHSITLSVNLIGDSEDKKNIEHFFALIDKELPC